MKKGLRIFLYVIVGLFVLGLIGKLTGVDKESKTPEGTLSTLTSAQKDSIASVEAKAIKDNTIKANDLVSFYSQNEVKADNELKGKEFYVSGEIESIGKDLMSNIYVTLKGNDPVRNVQCFIDDATVVAELHKGQRLLVKGTCNGLMMNVLMKDCTVMK